MIRRPLATFLLLLLLVVASSIQVVWMSQAVRQLHVELQSAQRDQDQHVAEQSRLLLERSALTAFQNVERIAEGELAMHFPESVERIER
ncbi:MAG: cell division protein FtsL [Pseudomonadales bacterium]